MQSRLTSFFSRYELLPPLLLFALFLAASLPGITWGAPALWNPDELVWRVDMALNRAMVFDETEPDYNYPSLPKYVMYAIGSITYGMGKSNYAFIVAARMFSAFLGAAGGVLIYYLARTLGAKKIYSTLAGLLYITSGIAAANGRFAHNDLYLQLFSILTVYFVIKYRHTPSKVWLCASFFAVGLAASSKYTGGSLILLPMVVHIFAAWENLRRRWLFVFRELVLGGLVAFLGYGAGTPRALISPIDYFSRVIPALQNLTDYGFNSGSPLGLYGQWPIFKSAVGIFAYHLFLLAFLWFTFRWLMWRMGKSSPDDRRAGDIGVLLVTVILFDLPFLISINYIDRYFIPFIPFLSILAAFLIEEMIAFLREKRWKFAPVLVALILTGGLFYSSLRLVSISLLFLNDPRIPATEYIAALRGYQKSIEYTLYPPRIEKRRFERAHNYPIYFVEWEGDSVPTGGRFEYNQGEQGLLERDTDYFVIDSFTYGRFYTESICETTPVECDFFLRLLAGEVESFRLLEKFTYDLPPYLPQVTISAVNPDILIYERVR